ncbi:hypothetical protein PYCCODRAFT_768232 [Trametes coccinea BRFM310]|uniref:Uncharacterized protein n=1 Tax=Trametes coccinea (strain BRFM310) TaxID=1353009 RepID=A0A1Y2J0A4_TRAC3|nr:hypothetical protein PYCCODRAFT_768232 [Trametes coccinea BRFM310]
MMGDGHGNARIRGDHTKRSQLGEAKRVRVRMPRYAMLESVLHSRPWTSCATHRRCPRRGSGGCGCTRVSVHSYLAARRSEFMSSDVETLSGGRRGEQGFRKLAFKSVVAFWAGSQYNTSGLDALLQLLPSLSVGARRRTRRETSIPPRKSAGTTRRP